MDIFTEYIVKKKKETKDYLLTGVLIGAAMFLTVVFLLLNRFLLNMGLILAFGTWWGAIYLIRMRSVEFEYILTNSELDIDKISARSSRKRIVSIDFKEIELCARVQDPNFRHVYENKDGVSVLNLAGDIREENVYFIDFHKDGEKKRVLFQPNTKIIESVKKLNPRAVNV